MKNIEIQVQSTSFPNQFASDAEKETQEYGLKIGQAIQATDGDSDSEFKERWIKSTSAAIAEAIGSSMKGLSVKPKGSKNKYRSK